MTRCTRFIRLLAALTLGAALIGCSAIKLAYNNLPEVAYWWLDGYVDFSDAQTPKARDDLAALLAWHREAELPKLVAVLQKAEALAPSDVMPAQACALVADIRIRLLAVAGRAEAPAAALAVTMSPAQLQTLARKYAKNNAAYAKDWLDLTPAQQQDKRYDKLLEQNEDFYGRLDSGQRELLRRFTAQSRFDAQRVDTERRKRQQETLALLRKLQVERPSATDAQAAIRAYIQRIAEPPPGAGRDYQQAMLEEGCRNAATLHNATRQDQRQKAVLRLRAYETDLRDLAATQVATARTKKTPGREHPGE
jgi:hypothetical protein